jgi:threonine dehydrogenase-like Zn-dependent dehydrogenase
MKASVLCDIGRMEVREVPTPGPSQYDVLVRVSAVGLCGTDSQIFDGHANYNTDERGFPIPLTEAPQILGHEMCGVIEEKGSGVSDLEIGEQVVLDQGLNCVSARRPALCEYCRTGDSHQCEFYREHGITGLQGGLAEFVALPAVNAIHVRTPLDSTEAALVEPLSCVIHSSETVARAWTRYAINAAEKDKRVRTILICGAGPAGLLFTQYLRRILGYDGLLLVSEPNDLKRSLAKRFGADEVLDPLAGDLNDGVNDRTKERGIDYLIEASGVGAVFESIPGLIRKQATVLIYGHGHAGVDLKVLNNIMFREPVLVTPVGASGGFDADGRPSVYSRALSLIEQRLIDVKSIVTHKYESLESVQVALSKEIRSPEYVKGVVVLQKPIAQA